MIRYWVYLNLSLAACVLFGSLSWDAWHNTLDSKEKWESGKVKLEVPVMGAAAFMVTYRPLAAGHLDLSTWFSYQEVIYNNKQKISSVDFDLKLLPGGELFLFLHREGETQEGLRLHQDSLRMDSLQMTAFEYQPTFYREVGEVGKLPVGANGWTHLELKRQYDVKSGHEFIVYDKDINYLSLKGNNEPVWIDNVRFADEEGLEVYKEDFSPKNGLWLRLIWVLPLLLLINGAVLKMPSWRKWTLRVLLGIALLSMAWYLFFLRSQQYKYQPGWTIQFQDYEDRILDSRTIRSQVLKRYTAPPAAGEKRMLFIGSSQTWGAGASKEEYTYVRQFEKLLSNSRDSLIYNCINTGISGMTSDSLLLFYQEDWLNLSPDQVIIDLSNNDRDTAVFRRSMEGFLQINRERGISTLLLLEPNDVHTPRLEVNHEILRQLAKAYDVPILDLKKEAQLEGPLLFWDVVHLTDLGQAKVAKALFKAFQKGLISPI